MMLTVKCMQLPTSCIVLLCLQLFQSCSQLLDLLTRQNEFYVLLDSERPGLKAKPRKANFPDLVVSNCSQRLQLNPGSLFSSWFLWGRDGSTIPVKRIRLVVSCAWRGRVSIKLCQDLSLQL